MSRIGKIPVVIPPKVKVEVKGRRVFVEGPKGKLDFEMPRRANAKLKKIKSSLRAKAKTPKRRRCMASPVRSSTTWSRA